MNLPQVRVRDIVIQTLKTELLVYDLENNQIYALNEISARVLAACGNGETFDDLKDSTQYTNELIALALDELRRNNLLAGE